MIIIEHFQFPTHCFHLLSTQATLAGVFHRALSSTQVLLLVEMKSKGRNASHSASGLMSLPLLMLAAIVAGFLLLFYITHAGDSSVFDSSNGANHKFGIAPRPGSTTTTIRAGSTFPSNPAIPNEIAATQFTAKPTSTSVKSISQVAVVGSSAAQVKRMLTGHPFHSLSPAQRSSMSLEDHFVYLQKQAVCKDVPIFTSMANVFSDLYWQL